MTGKLCRSLLLLVILTASCSSQDISPTAFTVAYCGLAALGFKFSGWSPLPEKFRQWLLMAPDLDYERRVRIANRLSSLSACVNLCLFVLVLRLYGRFGWSFSEGILVFPLLLAAASIISPLGIVSPLSELIEESRVYPLLRAIELCDWPQRWRESFYRAQLMEHLGASLNIRQKQEYAVFGGTHVDLWVEYRKYEWFIRIKKELNNQKRLNLQGERQDIAEQCGKTGTSNFGIIDIVGVSQQRPAEQQSHVANLAQIMRAWVGTQHRYRLVEVRLSAENPSGERVAPGRTRGTNC